MSTVQALPISQVRSQSPSLVDDAAVLSRKVLITVQGQVRAALVSAEELEYLEEDSSQSPVEQSDLSVSINQATQDELEALPGVGPVSAQKIIDNRPYASIDELISKKVISSSTFEKIKELITL